METYLWMAGSLPLLILGSIHLFYTFFTNKFSTRNPNLEAAMKASSPLLTKEISMWSAWVGFNASHSSGVMYIGLVNFLVAALHLPLLYHPIFIVLNLSTVAFYLWLAKKYWFSTPMKGVAISLGFFVAATLVMLVR